MRIIKARAFIAVLVLIALGFAIDRFVSHQHLLWRELNPDAPIGLSTRTQLLRVGLSPSSYCAALANDASGLNSLAADPHKPNKTCGWTHALHIQNSGDIHFAKDPVMQCPLGLGVHIWAQHVDRLAVKTFGSELKSIHHAGTYSCRRQNGNSSNQWSEHAFANAFDVTGFGLADGRVISVLKGWNGSGKEKAFLRRARDTACKLFRVTLSPDFNAAHADHFHFDMGPVSSCR